MEDPRFLKGEGRYVDDITLPNMLHAAIKRSPHAHALIKSIDTSKAEALPGVVRVLTGKDAEAHAGQLPSFSMNPNIRHDMIVVDKVRHYGDDPGRPWRVYAWYAADGENTHSDWHAKWLALRDWATPRSAQPAPTIHLVAVPR